MVRKETDEVKQQLHHMASHSKGQREWKDAIIMNCEQVRIQKQ
jgi:hypothetical protein